MIEEGALSDNILPSSSKEVKEKEDDLTLKGIPSRHNSPLTTRNNDWSDVTKSQTNSPRNKLLAKDKGNSSKVNWKPLRHDEEIFKEGIQPKQNLASATKKQVIGNPPNNGWDNVTKFQTNSPWNKVSAKDKGNPSKVNWKPLWHDEDDTTPNQSTGGCP